MGAGTIFYKEFARPASFKSALRVILKGFKLFVKDSSGRGSIEVELLNKWTTIPKGSQKPYKGLRRVRRIHETIAPHYSASLDIQNLISAKRRVRSKCRHSRYPSDPRSLPLENLKANFIFSVADVKHRARVEGRTRDGTLIGAKWSTAGSIATASQTLKGDRNSLKKRIPKRTSGGRGE
ncbi:hypothetical protein AAG570_004761 [Ranatra chinensis]|uniref:Uncharacterized protein n=1 Tax=Ranatra chinensis TaxID=642074 RepID=A0ABD0Y371_9HEMI